MLDVAGLLGEPEQRVAPVQDSVGDRIRTHTGSGRDIRTDLFQNRRHHIWDNQGDTATPRHRDAAR
ncbi:hypothetical protein [Streptomyces sp. NPDC091259]|uniref:hypothetical protein n=1 Tax=Streptomyces sp. NPDC091259 TaxID=3365976 RepID=UPI0038273C73